MFFKVFFPFLKKNYKTTAICYRKYIEKEKKLRDFHSTLALKHMVRLDVGETVFESI